MFLILDMGLGFITKEKVSIKYENKIILKENSSSTKLISPSLGCLSICELSRYTGYSPGTQTITYTVLEESRFSKHPVHSFPRGSLRQGAFPHTSLHRREMGIKSENRSKTSTKNFNNSDSSKY